MYDEHTLQLKASSKLSTNLYQGSIIYKFGSYRMMMDHFSIEVMLPTT